MQKQDSFFQFKQKNFHAENIACTPKILIKEII